MGKYYIVWNERRTEGFITDCPEDAEYASSGFQQTGGVSSLAFALRETYLDPEEEESGELPMQEVDL